MMADNGTWPIATQSKRGREGGGKGECSIMVNHTNTTRSYISSNHDGALSCLEFIQDPVTLVLLLVTMNS